MHGTGKHSSFGNSKYRTTDKPYLNHDVVGVYGFLDFVHPTTHRFRVLFHQMLQKQRTVCEIDLPGSVISKHRLPATKRWLRSPRKGSYPRSPASCNVQWLATSLPKIKNGNQVPSFRYENRVQTYIRYLAQGTDSSAAISIVLSGHILGQARKKAWLIDGKRRE